MKQYKSLIYIKNMKDPSAYYRLGQYLQSDTMNQSYRVLSYAPDWLYKYYYDNPKGKPIIKKLLLVSIGIIRITYYILWDMLLNHSKKVVVNRQMYPRYLPFFVKQLLKTYLKKKTLYWDFDDNIIYSKEITRNEVQFLEEYSKNIIVTNEYLKNTIAKGYQDKVILLPTTDATYVDISLEYVNRQRMLHYDNQIIILWIGTKSSLIHLEQIISVLDSIADTIEKQYQKKVVLQVLCNKPLQCNVKKLEVNNIEWTRVRADEELLKAHIGIMPLADNQFTRGKGGFKGIQYISAGLPCIMSDAGFNKEVIENRISGFLVKNNTEWVTSILELSNNKELWSRYSMEARKRWESKFSSNNNQEFWNKILGLEDKNE